MANNEILLKVDDEYLRCQRDWGEEVKEKMSQNNSKIETWRNVDDMIQKRKEELQQAIEIRELYERKLEKAHNLYFELNTVLIQLNQREKELIRREKALNINNDKIVRPILRREFGDKNKTYSKKSLKQIDMTSMTQTVQPTTTKQSENGEDNEKLKEEKVEERQEAEREIVEVEERPQSVTSLDSYKGDELAKLSDSGEAQNFRPESANSRHSSRQNSTPDSFSVAQVNETSNYKKVPKNFSQLNKKKEFFDCFFYDELIF